MNVKKLENNIIDMLIEQQLKLGYMEESVRLYYPLNSLAALLDIDRNQTKNMLLRVQTALDIFREDTKDRLGDVKIDRKGERFCIIISKEGGRYVYENIPQKLFIKDLINLVSHHCSMDEVFRLFFDYSDNVCIQEVLDNDFKYLIYFEDGAVDDYYYCFNIEGEHVIYHRYTRADYEEIFN